MKAVVVARLCPKCQAITERYASGACKRCANARSAAWAVANAEKIKTSLVAWRVANPEKVKAQIKAWNSENQERKKSSGAARVPVICKKKNARNVAWRAANPEKVKANNAAWAAANPEAIRIHSQNRRARQRAAGGVLSKGLAEKLFKLQKGMCPCCQQPLGRNHHLDHIMPLALGGSNTDDNMQLLRQRCNNQKSKKDPLVFMQSREFLL